MRIFLAALIAACLCAGASRAQEPDGPRPYEASPAASGIVLSQADPRWAGMRLGNGTMRGQGCLATVMATIGLIEGIATDPLQMVRSFFSNGLFSRAGLLYTSSIGRVLPGLAVLARGPFAPSGYDAARERLAAGQHVILKLDRDTRRRGIQQHWVLATEVSDRDFVVSDPNGGRTGLLRTLYGSSAIVEMMVVGRA